MSVISGSMGCYSIGKNRVLAESTSQPFSAFRSLASLSVLANTRCSLSAGGLGHASGLRNVKSCLTTAGRCLTISALEDGRDGVSALFLCDGTNGNNFPPTSLVTFRHGGFSCDKYTKDDCNFQ